MSDEKVNPVWECEDLRCKLEAARRELDRLANAERERDEARHLAINLEQECERLKHLADCRHDSMVKAIAAKDELRLLADTRARRLVEFEEDAKQLHERIADWQHKCELAWDARTASQDELLKVQEELSTAKEHQAELIARYDMDAKQFREAWEGRCQKALEERDKLRISLQTWQEAASVGQDEIAELRRTCDWMKSEIKRLRELDPCVVDEKYQNAKATIAELKEQRDIAQGLEQGLRKRRDDDLDEVRRERDKLVVQLDDTRRDRDMWKLKYEELDSLCDGDGKSQLECLQNERDKLAAEVKWVRAAKVARHDHLEERIQELETENEQLRDAGLRLLKESSEVSKELETVQDRYVSLIEREQELGDECEDWEQKYVSLSELYDSDRKQWEDEAATWKKSAAALSKETAALRKRVDEIPRYKASKDHWEHETKRAIKERDAEFELRKTLQAEVDKLREQRDKLAETCHDVLEESEPNADWWGPAQDRKKLLHDLRNVDGAAKLLAIRDVIDERHRQDRKHPDRTCADPIALGMKLAILGEEYGEVCRELYESAQAETSPNETKLRTELIQVAAVAVAWAESL